MPEKKKTFLSKIKLLVSHMKINLFHIIFLGVYNTYHKRNWILTF